MTRNVGLIMGRTIFNEIHEGLIAEKSEILELYETKFSNFFSVWLIY